jgi:hypothetical protein
MDSKNVELNKTMVDNFNNSIDTKIDELETKMTIKYQSDIKMHGDEYTNKIMAMIKLLGTSLEEKDKQDKLQLNEINHNIQQNNNNGPTVNKRTKNSGL